MKTSSISLPSNPEAAVLRLVGTAADPYLAGGFLIGSSLLGLLIIIGAFWYHRNNLSLFKRSCIMSFFCQDYRLMSVQLVHSSLVTLLFMDALNTIMAISFGATVAILSFNGVNWCNNVQNVWFLSRWFGVIIHLVNASLCIDHLHQSLSVTRVHIVHLVISVVIFIVVLLYLCIPEVAIFTLDAFIFLFALSVIVRSTAFTSSPSTGTLKKQIVVIAVCNFLVVFVPTFILQCLLYTAVYYDDLVNYINAYVNVVYFTNLHLIFDGFLCALILKLPSGEEQQQQQQLGFQNPRYTVSTTVNQ